SFRNIVLTHYFSGLRVNLREAVLRPGIQIVPNDSQLKSTAGMRLPEDRTIVSPHRIDVPNPIGNNELVLKQDRMALNEAEAHIHHIRHLFNLDPLCRTTPDDMPIGWIKRISDSKIGIEIYGLLIDRWLSAGRE